MKTMETEIGGTNAAVDNDKCRGCGRPKDECVCCPECGHVCALDSEEPYCPICGPAGG